MANTYNSPHAAPDKIIKDLAKRGMIIRDSTLAEQQIELMGYARFRMYETSRCEHLKGDFTKGTTFENIINIHNCDERIRTACFLAVSQFEILFRNSVSEALSINHGPFPYEDPEAFVSEKIQKRIISALWLVYKQNRNKSNTLLKEEYGFHDKSKLPAIWHLKELLEFRHVADLYEALHPDIRTPIGKTTVLIEEAFGMRLKDDFFRWIEAFKILRNACAHHSRVFDSTFKKKIHRMQFRNSICIPQRGVDCNKLAAVLQCLDYVMAERKSPVNVEVAVKEIIDEYKEIKNKDIGYS